MASINLKIDKTEQIGNTYAKYEIYPFQRGYGNTFAAPIRRILLSSIKGVSITSIKIKNVDHEFSTMKGVKDDVLRILINLSKVVFKIVGSDKEKFTIKVHGKRVVTAADIKVSSNVEVINVDTYIAELTDDKATFELEGIVETGYGFELADNELRNAEPGLIPVNKNFSPVDKVNVNVVATRVGQQTDLEKIVLEITTNGNVTPDKALKESLATFVERLDELNNIVQDFDGSLVEGAAQEDVKEVANEQEE